MKSPETFDCKIKELIVAYLGMINRPSGLKPLQALPQEWEGLIKGRG